MNEAKDCPCCGSPAEIYEDHIGCTIQCTKCDVGLVNKNWTKQFALDIWNKRPGK